MSKLLPWYLPTEDPAHGVLRQWVREKCTLRMQAVLISAVRGCDGAPKNDPSKKVLWEMRFDCLNPSIQGNIDPFMFSSFMGYTHDIVLYREEFLSSLDQYPFHFVAHVAHAAEIIAAYHPAEHRRRMWDLFYKTIVVDAFHCSPESKSEMERRLRDR